MERQANRHSDRNMKIFSMFLSFFQCYTFKSFETGILSELENISRTQIHLFEVAIWHKCGNTIILKQYSCSLLFDFYFYWLSELAVCWHWHWSHSGYGAWVNHKPRDSVFWFTWISRQDGNSISTMRKGILIELYHNHQYFLETYVTPFHTFVNRNRNLQIDTTLIWCATIVLWFGHQNN